MIAPCVHITKPRQQSRDDCRPAAREAAKEAGSEGGAGGDRETCATPGRLFPLMMYCTLEVAIWATPDRAGADHRHHPLIRTLQNSYNVSFLGLVNSATKRPK